MQGLASWYGGKFHGRLTSSGEVFDTNEMTAAHRTLPFGTMVKVTNLDNGQSAVVKINDRGPSSKGGSSTCPGRRPRRWTCSATGVARVSLEIVAFATDKEMYAIQVGAYGLEKNAEKARLALERRASSSRWRGPAWAWRGCSCGGSRRRLSRTRGRSWKGSASRSTW